MKDSMNLVDRYLVTLRIIQPARVQDVATAYAEMWGDDQKDQIYRLHERLKSDGLLVDIRRGTYVLTAKGMSVAATLVKEREIDNRRLFLMKRQRRLYH